MHILICHERFLSRFGADRVLILLGQSLRSRGHQITLMGNRFDRAIVDSFADHVIEIPSDAVPYLDLSEYTADWLRVHWTQPADLVVVGGWPFFSAIPFFRERNAEVVFVDFGVVPADGCSEGMRITLEKLHMLRRQHLPQASL